MTYVILLWLLDKGILRFALNDGVAYKKSPLLCEDDTKFKLSLTVSCVRLDPGSVCGCEVI
ncbi:MAG: hypothetical protein OHK0017_08750 [Patescibacteria group bacterium]